ncbi:MAG: NifU family protein [Bacteroidetes bacterium]|jgi:Fe-S cluster biogenesis protein NfuA|nr:MAG: NifU family protein [Bacteroidota bacterium]
MQITDSLYSRTEDALDTIRPYLATDGGNVKIVEITDEGILHLELLGSCGTCPMSAMTMKAGIEEAVRRLVPEIHQIQAVKG